MTEHAEQSLLVQRASLAAPRIPALRLLYAVPNGGDRHPVVAAKLKREGAKAGIPDLHLPVARNGHIGLWVEMKRRRPRVTKTKGVQWSETRPTPEQLEWIAALRTEGHRVEVCYTADEAWSVIMGYLGVQG
jgi:hypothetical protein